MASRSVSQVASAPRAAPATESTPAQGTLESAGAGITGGYTGDSLSLRIIIALLLGLALYNALELIVLVFATFQRYQGLYFWALVVSALGIIPYSLGFLVKFFQLLDPSEDVGYVAVFLLTVGWWTMVSGQSVVLWSRLHLVANSRRLLRWTLYMIMVNGTILHSITTVLTWGSNSNTLSNTTLRRFVHGYSIMEKIQMAGFFLQEFILSVIYIKETIRLLKLSEAVQDDARSLDDGAVDSHLRNANVRKTMYQLIAINILIITMDLALLSVAFANLYLIETTLKGVVYSVKLKLEFAVLGKLVQLVRVRTESDGSMNHGNNNSSSGGGGERRTTSHHHHAALTLEKTNSGGTHAGTARLNGAPSSCLTHHSHSGNNHAYPDFVDARRVHANVNHAEPVLRDYGWETRAQDDCQDSWRRRTRVQRGSWIDEEMDRHNIA